MKEEWEPIINNQGIVYFYNKKEDKIIHTFPNIYDGTKYVCNLYKLDNIAFQNGKK